MLLLVWQHREPCSASSLWLRTCRSFTMLREKVAPEAVSHAAWIPAQTGRMSWGCGFWKKGRDVGGGIMWAQSCRFLWTAGILLFSQIFLLFPHMFSLWLLSSLSLCVSMLLGNKQKNDEKSRMCCGASCEMWCVFTSARKDRVQYRYEKEA